MDVTEVRVKLTGNRHDKLRAFCSITFDQSFVVRDLKIIEGARGPFVAMPSRKLADRCPKCRSKNHLRARFCNDCGAKFEGDRSAPDPAGRERIHADIAHPINAEARQAIESKILAAYQAELEKSKLPGYQPSNLGDEDFDDALTL